MRPRRLYSVQLLILLTTFSSHPSRSQPVNKTILCYDCKPCGPDNRTWTLVPCTGNCFKEFTRYPDSKNATVLRQCSEVRGPDGCSFTHVIPGIDLGVDIVCYCSTSRCNQAASRILRHHHLASVSASVLLVLLLFYVLTL